MTGWLVVCETAAVPRRTVLLASALARRVDVEVFCWSRLGTDQIPAEIRTLVRLSRGRSLVGFLAELTGRIRERGYAGIVVADPRVLAGLVLTAAGPRLVYDRMEIPTLTVATKLAGGRPRSFRRVLAVAEALESRLTQHCDLVLTIPIGGAPGRHLARLPAPSMVVPNWPTLAEVIATRSRPGVDDGLTVVHSGAVSTGTGLDQALDAVGILGAESGVRLVMVGYPVGVSTEDLQRTVQRRGLEDRVEVRPRVPYAELGAILAGAHVGLGLLDPADPKFGAALPGMSRKVFTYMAAGLAVVANGETGRWLEERGAGMCVPFGDAVALARALGELRADPDRLRRLGDAGARAVRERFHWERIEDSVAEAVLGREGSR